MPPLGFIIRMKALEKVGTPTVHDTNQTFHPALPDSDTHLIFSHSFHTEGFLHEVTTTFKQ